LAALRAGKVCSELYHLLGDDLIIYDEAIAKEYIKLAKELDIPISPQKTYMSSDLCEFAKRWHYKGVEITPFSVSGLSETRKRYSMFAEFLENQRSHGWDLPEMGGERLRRFL